MNPKHYQGKPCKQCGETWKYVKGKSCVACAKRRGKEWANTYPALRRRAVNASNRKRYSRMVPIKRLLDGLPMPTREETRICECCGTESLHRRLCLDHCHSTGKFRGWLCTNCNSAIGKLGDTVEGVQRAIKYLQENG